VERIILSRHGESVATARGMENGDPERDEGLTPAGREQARELGQVIAEDPIEICVTSEFPRTEETAKLALIGRPVPFQVLPMLNDIRYGTLEGQPRAAYLAWARRHGVTTPIPGGGESRVQVARRLCVALETVLSLPQRAGLVVTHELLVADLLVATRGEISPQVRPTIEFATPYRFDSAAVQDAIEMLRLWAQSQEDGVG
jgi:broad specificity phosphatase PhoE